jgi:hypothetical protein
MGVASIRFIIIFSGSKLPWDQTRRGAHECTGYGRCDYNVISSELNINNYCVFMDPFSTSL